MYVLLNLIYDTTKFENLEPRHTRTNECSNLIYINRTFLNLLKK
jgi:hypothetical protein